MPEAKLLSLDSTSSGWSNAGSVRLAEPPADTVVGGTYRLTNLLGRGTMGRVFEATHVRLGKTFAIKFMHETDVSSEQAVSRFREEVRALSAISSTHVVSIMDCGTHEGVPYLVMERLIGADLRATLEGTPRLPVGRAIQIMAHAARGLAAVHRAGLVHRDLKPANLFLTREDDGREVTKILDFGVVRRPEGNGTRSGGLVGTIRYMSPEQLGDSRAVGPHSDIYALGCIIYECLAGQPPHPGESVEELMFNILHRPPPALAARRPDVSESLADLIGWAMARTPGERCSSALELLRHLSSLPPSVLDEGGDTPTNVDRSQRDEQTPTRPARRRSVALLPTVAGASFMAVAAVAVAHAYAPGAAEGPRAAEPARPTAEAPPRVAVTPPPMPSTSPSASPAAATATPSSPREKPLAASMPGPRAQKRPPAAATIRPRAAFGDVVEPLNPYVD